MTDFSRGHRIILPHWIRAVACMVLTWLAGVSAALSQQPDGILQDFRSREPTRVFRALDAVGAFQGDTTELVPELTALVESPDVLISELAIRVLTRMHAKARPAVPALCKRLNDRRHATRAAAVDALTAIGEPSVLSVRRFLGEASGRARASAAEVSIYVAKRPDVKLDWSRGMDQETAYGTTDTVNKAGEFTVTIDLRQRIQQDRKRELPYQFGLALAEHKNTGQGSERVYWTSKTPATPSSVCMLNVPAAPPLSRELELIHRASGWPFSNPNGVDLIRAVNALQPLGKDKALETLEKYAELTNDFHYHMDGQEIVFWIIRLLFEPVRLNDRIPVPAIAVHLADRHSADAALWPLNPIEVIDDIPFMVGDRISMGGMPEHPSSHIRWARRHGVIRDETLRPTNNPLAAAQQLLRSPKFQNLDAFQHEQAARAIRLQAISMVGDILTTPPSKRPRNSKQAELDWQLRVREVQLLNIKWDSTEERFVAASKE